MPALVSPCACPCSSPRLCRPPFTSAGRSRGDSRLTATAPRGPRCRHDAPHAPPALLSLSCSLHCGHCPPCPLACSLPATSSSSSSSSAPARRRRCRRRPPLACRRCQRRRHGAKSRAEVAGLWFALSLQLHRWLHHRRLLSRREAGRFREQCVTLRSGTHSFRASNEVEGF